MSRPSRSSIASYCLTASASARPAPSPAASAASRPLKPLLEGFAVAIALFEIGLDLRAVQTGIEIGQVPFGQFSEFRWFFRLSPQRGLWHGAMAK